MYISPTILALLVLAGFFVFLGWKSRIARDEKDHTSLQTASQAENVFSLFAVIGAGEYILAIGLVYQYGLLAPTFMLALAASLWLLKRYVREIRRTVDHATIVDGYRHYSVPDFLFDRLGGKASQVSAVITSIAFFAIIELQFTAGAKLLAALSEMQYAAGVLLLCITLIAYLWLGGVKALLHTDVWQGVLMWVGLVSVVVYILVFDSSITIKDSISRSLDLSLISYQNIYSDPTLISIFILTVAAAFAGPDFWQRIAGFSASDSDAQKSCNRAAWTIFAFAIPTTLLAVHATQIVPKGSQQPLIDYMSAVVSAGSTILPVPLQMIFAIGLLAAFLSTADTSAMLLSNVINAERVRDRRDGTRRQSESSTRTLITVICIASAILSIFYTDLTEKFIGALGILSAQGVPVLAVVIGRGTRLTVIFGIVVGAVCALAQTYILPPLGFSAYTQGWWTLLPLVFGCPAILVRRADNNHNIYTGAKSDET
jgi:Na+/proline symporter